jgi:hypothetical protein
MLSKVFEWLRAADLTPDNAMVTSRTKAVKDLESKIRESNDCNLLLGTVTAVVGGCERLGEQSPVFAALLECVRIQSPAFPSAISENTLHLRIISCLGLYELLASDDDGESDGSELLAASMLVSGLGLKTKEAGVHLDKVFEELGSVARAKLQKQAVALRERDDLVWDEFNSLQDIAEDPPTFNLKLLPAMKGLIEGLQKQHQSDREELEVMWWLYNGYSERIAKQIKSATPFLAATAIGCELADRVAAPATTGLRELVTQAALRDRKPAQVMAKPIEKIVTELGESGRKLLLPTAEHVRKFVRSTGTLCPLSWLSLRLEESDGASGWEAELQSKTGLASDHELAPGELAAQVFAERQAQRVYQYLVEGKA